METGAARTIGVVEFPGVFAIGDNLDELRESLQEGIALALEGDGEVPKVTIAALRHATVEMTVSSKLVFA
jgi:predicted RNase H-like HicB family nuclease